MMSISNEIVLYGTPNEDMYEAIHKIPEKNICYIINPNHKDDEGDFFGIPVYKDHEIADSTDVLVTGEFQNKGGIEDLLNRNIAPWTTREFPNSEDYGGIDRNYFYTEKYMSWQDNDLLERYLYDRETLTSLFTEHAENWYRYIFQSERNRRFVELMQLGREKSLKDYTERYYQDGTKAFDEYFSRRPGMRLVYNIIRKSASLDTEICDFGSGHGELINKLHTEGYSCSALDQSAKRADVTSEDGIKCIHGSIENSGFGDESFDIEICLECLEHVSDVNVAIQELYRCLRKSGRLFITVPFGRNCGSDSHVRFFDESSLYSAVVRENFFVTHEMKIPYLNGSRENSLFLEAEKL